LVVEIKCLSHGVVGKEPSRWVKETEAKLYIPAPKILQVYSQMAISGAPQAYLASFYPGKNASFQGAKLRIHRLEFNERYWQDKIRPAIIAGFEALERFDLNYVATLTKEEAESAPRTLLLDEELPPSLVRDAYEGVYGEGYMPRFLRPN
jgi:hypothetical protein